MKYADRIITDTGFESTHVLKVDQNRLQDFFSVNCTWFWRSNPDQIVDGAEISDCNHVICLVGADPENPYSLAGEIDPSLPRYTILSETKPKAVPPPTSIRPSQKVD